MLLQIKHADSDAHKNLTQRLSVREEFTRECKSESVGWGSLCQVNADCGRGLLPVSFSVYGVQFSIIDV